MSPARGPDQHRLSHRGRLPRPRSGVKGVSTMRVLLIGSTGVLGREAVPRLLAAGHMVTGLARNDDRAKAVHGLGIEPVVADLFDQDSMIKALDGQEAVLNLATRIPVTAGAMLK